MNDDLYKRSENITKLFEQNRMDARSHLPAHLRREIELQDIYTDFVLSFLIKKWNYKGKIDQLALKLNHIDISFEKFLSEQKAIDYRYVEVIKRRKKSVTLKITDWGLDHFNSSATRYKIKYPNIILRISIFLKKFFSNIFNIVVYEIPDFLKKISESGPIKFIIFLMALFTFLVKWKEIKLLLIAYLK
jgi:hypothetical protein